MKAHLRFGGMQWNVIGLAHETVRALAQSPTDPKFLLAGALSGVYRSQDNGASWERITPSNHPDLNRFDSLAFDPKDNNTIYAGTYHLPWKKTNGGKDWFPIVKDMIDDSDVMNIIVDPANVENVHAVACSGLERRATVGEVLKYSERVPPHTIDSDGSFKPEHPLRGNDQRALEDRK